MKDEDKPIYDNIMREHINASLSEKVEILANNPKRYYLKVDVWTEASIERLDILNLYFLEALNEKNYDLCKRISEVKNILSGKDSTIRLLFHEKEFWTLRSEVKKVVDEKFDELDKLLYCSLQFARSQGGTIGHCVGSVKESVRKQRIALSRSCRT